MGSVLPLLLGLTGLAIAQVAPVSNQTGNAPIGLPVFMQAIANIESGHVHGKILFEQPSTNAPVKINGLLLYLPEGSHAVIIYDSSNSADPHDCSNLSDHFNPLNKNHGPPYEEDHHAGDLGNIESFRSPNVLTASLSLTSTSISLSPNDPKSILNRTIAVHEYADDFKGSSLGRALGCGTIMLVEAGIPGVPALPEGATLQKPKLGVPQIAFDDTGSPYVIYGPVGPAGADGTQPPIRPLVTGLPTPPDTPPKLNVNQGTFGPQGTVVQGATGVNQGMYGPQGTVVPGVTGVNQGMYGPQRPGLTGTTYPRQGINRPIGTGSFAYSLTGQRYGGSEGMYVPTGRGIGSMYSQPMYGQQGMGQFVAGQAQHYPRDRSQAMYGPQGALAATSAAGRLGAGVMQTFDQAVANIESGPITGKILFRKLSPNGPVLVQGIILNLPAGTHGVIIYEGSNPGTVNDCSNLGDHFNPTNARHGSPDQDEHHAGDLGNIQSIQAQNGLVAPLELSLDFVSLRHNDPRSILGRTIVIHEYADDFVGGMLGNALVCATIVPLDFSPTLGPPRLVLDASGVPRVVFSELAPLSAAGMQPSQFGVPRTIQGIYGTTTFGQYGTQGVYGMQGTGQGMYSPTSSKYPVNPLIPTSGLPFSTLPRSNTQDKYGNLFGTSNMYDQVGTGSQAQVSQPVFPISDTTGSAGGMYGQSLAASSPVTELESDIATVTDVDATAGTGTSNFVNQFATAGSLYGTDQIPYTGQIQYTGQGPFIGQMPSTGQNPYTGQMYQSTQNAYAANPNTMSSGDQYPFTGSSIGSLGRGWESPFDPTRFPGNRYPGSTAGQLPISRTTAQGTYGSGYKRSLENQWKSDGQNVDSEFFTQPKTFKGSAKTTDTENVWKPGNVYEYKYSGYMSAGMPAISPQFAGATIEGTLTVEPRDEQTLVVTLSGLRARVFNEDVMEEFAAELGKEVPVQEKESLEKPIIVTIVSGSVQSVSVGSDEPLWVINFKRGVVAQLQLQLDQSAGIFEESLRSDESYAAGTVLYPVQEGGSTGDCETWYSISRLTEEQVNAQPELLPSPELCQGQATYEIFKTRNLDKCDKTPVFNTVSPKGIACQPDDASCENFISHSDMTRIIACTTEDASLLVQRISAVDKLILKPFYYETEPIVGSAIQKIELENVRSTSSSSFGTRLPLQAGERTLNTLVFSYDEDMYASGPFMKQPGLKEVNTPWVVDPKDDVVKSEARRLMQELVKTMESEDFYATPNMYGAADKYNMLRKAFMFLNYDDLRPLVVSVVDTQGNSVARKIVLDALTGAGTNPAVLILQEMIIKGAIEGEEANQAISLLPAVVKTPTKELFDLLTDFLTSDTVQQSFQLKVTTALAVTKLFYQACVNTTIANSRFPVLVMGEFCNPNDDFFIRKLLPYLSETLHNADDLGEQTATLLALRNIGHESIIPIVTPYITHCDPSLEDEESFRLRRTVSKSKKRTGSKVPEEEEEVEIGEEEEVEEEQTERKGERGRGKPEKVSGKTASKFAKTVAKERKAVQKIEAQRRQQDLEFKKLEAAERLRQQEENQRAKFEKKKAKVLKKPVIGEEMQSDAAYSPLKEKDSCTILRTTAIYALKQLSMDGEQQIYDILLPIYNNKAEDPEIRIAAIHNVILSNPPVGVWQKLAASTWFEPSPLVSSFIYHVINSYVFLDNPMLRSYSTKAEAVMPLVKPHPFWSPHHAMTHFYGDYSEQSRLGYAFGYMNIPSVRSFMPSLAFSRLFSTAGPTTRLLYEVMMQGNQLEKFIDFYLGQPSVRNQKGVLSEIFNLGGSYSPSKPFSGSTSSGKYPQVPFSQEFSEQLEKIHQELQIEARAKASPELTLGFNFQDIMQRFFYVDESTFQQTIQSILRSVATGGSGTTFNYMKWLPTADAFVRIPSSMGLSFASYTHFKVLLTAKGQLQGNFALHGTSDFKALVKPILSMKYMSKIGLEVPFTTVMPQAGSDWGVSGCLPSKIGFKADYGNSQLITTWEPIGNKPMHVFHRKVQSFTGVRNINDFTPIILHPDSKRIVLLDKPIEEMQYVGEQESGLKMYVLNRGDVQSLQDPFPFVNDPMGYLLHWTKPSTLRNHEKVLVLDLAASRTKQIRTTLSCSFQTKAGSDVKVDMYGRKITSPSVGLTLTPGNKPSDVVMSSGRMRIPVDLKPVSLPQYVSGLFGIDAPQWTTSKFQKVFEPMESGYGVSVDTTIEFLGSATPKRYGSSITTGYGDMGSRSRFEWRVKRQLGTSADSDYEIGICGDWKWPQLNVVNRQQLFKADLSTFMDLKIRFGNSNCEQNPSIAIKGTFSRTTDQQTSSQMKYMDSKCAQDEARGFQTSLQCMQSRRIATTLNKYDLDIKYQQVPTIFQNITNKVANAIRYWYVPHLTENLNVRNPDNQVRVETTVYTLLGSMNVHVYKPHSNVFYDDIRIHPIAQTLVPINVKISPLSHQYSPAGMCLLDKEKVVTFDGLPYNVSLSGCDHVLTKDCSGRYAFAVLVREEMGNKVVTMLLNDQKLELKPYMNHVKLNDGQEQSVSASQALNVKDKQGSNIAVVRITADNYLQVNAPQHWITLTLNPQQITVMGAMVHRGRLCGLCGSQNGERNDDLRGPRGCALPAEYMDDAYRLDTPTQSCKASLSNPAMLSSIRSMQDSCAAQKSHEKPYKLALTGFSAPTNYGEEKCTHLRHEIQEIEGLQCFSLVPVKWCSSMCRPVGMNQQRVNFHCMPKNNLSEYLRNEAERRLLNELHGKPVHKILTYNVPVSCSQF